MSSLSPRVAVLIAVTTILPTTVAAIFHFDIVMVDKSTSNKFKLTRPYESCVDEPANCEEVEGPKKNGDILALNVSSKSLANSDVSLRPVRRGPQILRTDPYQHFESAIFAAADDPFTESGTSHSTLTSTTRSIQQLDLAPSEESAGAASPKRLQPTLKQYCIDSVVAVPCQSKRLFVNRNQCCIEINMFRGISNLILHPLR